MNRRPRSIRNKGVIASAKVQRKPEAGQRLDFRLDQRTRRLVRPLLITLLATSVSVALLAVVRIFSPEIEWMGLAPFCFLVALEGAYTSAWLNNPDSQGVDRLVYRITEIMLVLVAARIYSWLLFGGGIPSPEELRILLTAPVSIIYVGGFLTTIAVTLVAWWIASSLGRTFARLDVSVYEVQFYTLSQAEQKAFGDDRPIQIAREELVGAYLQTWLTIGMLMVIAAALSTYEVNQLSTVTNPFEITRLGLSSAMLFALITYFLSGFWLLSHARLLWMNARWLIDGVGKEPSLERSWQRSAMLVLLGIALIATFLPIGSTFAISRILSLGLAGVAYVAGLFVQVIGTIFAGTILLLTGNSQEVTGEAPVVVPTPPQEFTPPPATPPDPFVQMIATSAFWALLFAIVIGAFLYFLRERGYNLEKGRIQSNWQAVRAWWRVWLQSLVKRLRRTRQSMSERLRSVEMLASPEGADRLSRPRLPRLGGLPPRDQIRYYYLALVKSAGERGVNRAASETPLEYFDDLKENWPEAEGDFKEVTQAFLEARYSPQPIEKTAAHKIKARWRRLKNQLRGRK